MDGIVVDSYKKVQYTVIRSRKRRYAAVKITEEGNVELRVPWWFTHAMERQIIRDKQQWIHTHRRRMLERSPAISHTYRTGDLFYLKGAVYRLEVVQAANPEIYLHEDRIICVLSSKAPGEHQPENRAAHVKRKLRGWFAQQAHIEILKLFQATALRFPELSHPVQKVRFRRYKRRWGSCSTDGVLSFNTQLVCSPEKIISYVIIDELCHRVHFNHKKEFYSMLSTYVPDYRELEAVLKSESMKWRI